MRAPSWRFQHFQHTPRKPERATTTKPQASSPLFGHVEILNMLRSGFFGVRYRVGAEDGERARRSRRPVDACIRTRSFGRQDLHTAHAGRCRSGAPSTAATHAI